MLVKTLKGIENLIFWDFLIFYQIFLSLQVKQGVIIKNKNRIFEFPHEFPNDSRLTILENFRKISKLHEIEALCPEFLLKGKCCQYWWKITKHKILNFSRGAIYYMKSKVYLKCFVHNCLMIVDHCDEKLKNTFVDNDFLNF